MDRRPPRPAGTISRALPRSAISTDPPEHRPRQPISAHNIDRNPSVGTLPTRESRRERSKRLGRWKWRSMPADQATGGGTIQPADHCAGLNPHRLRCRWTAQPPTGGFMRALSGSSVTVAQSPKNAATSGIGRGRCRSAYSLRRYGLSSGITDVGPKGHSSGTWSVR